MADSKITALTELTTPADGDFVAIVDVSDTTQAGSGTTKKIQKSNLVTGTGDVVGPASSTDNAVVRFDGTTGKLVQNSGPTINDTGEIAMASKKITGVLDPTADQDASTKKYTDDLFLLGLYHPRGHMVNGKISVTVASNNLTVALKGYNGSDPSASNPVYVKIGDNIRTITSAISVTKNAGTNWCNSGSSELATKEIDYFVYLGYNATDGVTIGFSRFPGATEYDDFSTTSTNEKYCAISTITNAASGDDYELVGRFAATLSAGAGYTWTVPTFTNKNLIQRPIYETRWLDWVPTFAAQSGTPTTITKTENTYMLSSNICRLKTDDLVVDKGTATGYATMTLPYGYGGTNLSQILGREAGVTGYVLLSQLNAGNPTTMVISDYLNATPWVNNYRIVLTGFYEI